MGLSGTIRSGWWCGVCAVMLGCAMVTVLPARAARQKRVELTPWEQAERGREVLEAIPEGARTHADYTRAMDGFRTVYHDAPGDVHAPDSVNAVAELLAEQGRGLRDVKSSKAAVGQYEFLRVQYPGSSLRVGALLAEAQIYENDLHDAASARERYGLFVKQYPHSELMEEARAGLASLDGDSGRHRVVTAGGGGEGGGGE
ncbi:tol-pal system YbgF family protein, partial [Granulicella sp. L60]|uniref:tetratricopeptide repeat protein n=1 Tax=Granulicella sp. L60 TaxID=1641866 RepID=UPI00352B4E48